IRDGRESSLRCIIDTLGRDVYLSKLIDAPIDFINNLQIVCNHTSSQHSSLLKQHLEGFTRLRELSLDHCRITELYTGTFSGLRSLRNLTIRTYNTFNPVSLSIPPLLFRPLQHLERLDLS
ncbi:unnamed protein product, partial [Meganyctiphanes norvegica]